MARYPSAIWRPSEISHPQRRETRGVVIHWTAGYESGGDLPTLDGPNVDCHFYVAKDGDVYQFLDSASEAWHAYSTANRTCLGIEHEGFGEPYTPAQLRESARLTAWLTNLYGIPVSHVDPHRNWRGLFGHRDLKGIDGNNHTDTVPAGTRWDNYLTTIRGVAEPPADRFPTEGDTTLRVIVNGRQWSGWQNAAGPLRWIADPRNRLHPRNVHVIAWKGDIWPKDLKDRGTAKGALEVTNVAKTLVNRFL